MTNPFDDPDADYLALVNPQGQYSLWPAFAQLPVGWRIAHGEGTRDECLDYIDGAWTDQRPPNPVTAPGGGEAVTS
ncbi:MbtH family protein [Streptomyces sp. M2CJ-2]|uniref:MbtH family protein n=1 Tax=Streptomyces sp. M2CJ-2 TaxID=2803948 RepID=UPI0019252D3A|nr:MbtH family protein [Streptomyces sp. M2CJ-2]MBL3671384.1 MbtH family protein [Streptomyces sp. M2CJ-2]